MPTHYKQHSQISVQEQKALQKKRYRDTRRRHLSGIRLFFSRMAEERVLMHKNLILVNISAYSKRASDTPKPLPHSSLYTLQTLRMKHPFHAIPIHPNQSQSTRFHPPKHSLKREPKTTNQFPTAIGSCPTDVPRAIGSWSQRAHAYR